MAPPADLRDWIELLEGAGELVRVAAEVDPDLEVTEIVDRTVKAGGPALLFERPKGSDHALLINQFGSERRMCLAFGAGSLDDVAARVQSVIEMQPPDGLIDKVKGLVKLKSLADSMPKSVRSGPAQELVLEGDAVNLDLLPIQRCWPGDPAPFVTLPAVITKDPRTGGRRSCTGRCTRTAGWTIWRRTAGSTSPSRSGSTRSPPTRRRPRCRSTSTS
jgi:4-hydroxy-3-polyprenylbenzoate decarboxylase